jgi:NADH-quinone oxidoreductase subunit A
MDEFLSSNHLLFFFYTFVVLILVVAMLGISFVLGERHEERATNEPYESGIISTGDNHVRFSVKFYLAAMFFVVFDLESIYIYTYSTKVRELGWGGFTQIIVFIILLAATLIYLLKTGGLDFAPQLRKVPKNQNQLKTFPIPPVKKSL